VAGDRTGGRVRSRSVALRVGVLGGTFDPPHCGHLAAARAAAARLGLDRLLLVVANEPWQKVPQRSVTPAEDRFAMVQALVEAASPPVPGLEVSRLEIDRGGPSYTADTVDALRKGCGPDGRRGTAPELFLVVGADLVPGLATWKRVAHLQREVTLAVVSRPQSPHPKVPPGWRAVHLEAETPDVSSSEVRERLERGDPVDGIVPDAVVRCIRRRGLYAVAR
jgi:nicotinate-nucleotide adenylyltransferase